MTSPARGFFNAIHGPQVTVHAGEGDDRQTFIVPKALLCTYNWFDKALARGRYKEGETLTINLPDDSAQVFEYFHYHIYHKEVAFGAVPEEKEAAQDFVYDLCELWVFGDKYDIDGLRTSAMRQLSDVLKVDVASTLRGEKHDSLMTEETMQFCCEETAEGSKLRTLCRRVRRDHGPGSVLQRKIAARLSLRKRISSEEEGLQKDMGGLRLANAGET